MDVVTTIQNYISTWGKGGESECRGVLISPHCNPRDPNCVDVLTTVYHTLLSSALNSWRPKYTITPSAFVEFVQSVLEGLPSSSSGTSSYASAFGELLVDMIWAVDSELEEILTDAKSAITTLGEQETSMVEDVKDGSKKAAMGDLMKIKQYAEQDKETVTDIVKKFLASGTIPASVCRERLDLVLLAGVGLISDKAAFEKKEIRTRTGLFYKQNKFNLLREQSEGYSKLTAELTSSLGPAHSTATGRPTESYTSIEERARPVWEKVISLIGYFDLDPNRALDVILDVLSVHLTTHYCFFIALLSFSPWAAFYRRPKDEATMSVDSEVTVGEYKGKSLDEILAIAESKANKGREAIPASSGRNPHVLAQVLGFKFAYYQTPEANEPTPKNLYLTAAILIREGFVALEDLYPHLSSNDEEIEDVHKAYLAKVQQNISDAKISQLAMAAPLESSPPSSKPKPASEILRKSSNDAKDPPCQTAGLLNALLAVGALRQGIAILSKFPWMIDAYPEIADLMIRVMKVSLSWLYESTMVTKERNPSFTQPRARYGASGVSLPPPRKPLLTLWAPTPPSTSLNDFVFFYPDWSERVPLCSSLDDLVDVIEPIMRFIGLHISRDPMFLTKFLRLGRTHLVSTVPVNPETKKPAGEVDNEHPIRRFWFMILRLYLLPAVPLIRGNAVCTVEVWNIIRQYETTARWRLYGEWKSTVYNSHPELRIRQVQADRESKGILRRLSHNTIDSLAGTVAKLAHSNPCIFFTNAVNQIMAYDNLANVVIQALRYVTNMGFDVLVFIILDAFANPNKDRLKDDGVNTSDWLQSLASFTGMLFRRYSADLTPVLKYIVHQLYNGQTTEIVVLRELIWKMAGIEPLPNLSDSQIAAMAGGPVLRIEAVASSTRGARLDPGDAVLKGPQRLGKALLESSLALPLLIQVAQQRQSCVFKAPDAHLKSLAGLYDATHGVLLQYLELLTSPQVVSPKDYAHKVLPSLSELGETYGVCAPICMQIVRPMLNGALLAAALSVQEQERMANEEAEKRLKAALTAKREPSTAASRLASPALGSSNIPTETPSDSKPPARESTTSQDVVMEVDVLAPAISAPAQPESPWVPELASLFDDIKKIAPGNVFDVIGPGFYVTFWQLSTYDLAPPGSKYDEEGAALRMLSRSEDSKYIAADRSADRAKRLTAGAHRSRRDRYNVFVNTLAQEFKEQTVSREFTMKRLGREKQHWFAHCPKGTALVASMIEHCIQPRCLLSPMDADFCAQFIKVMHTQGTPGFPTLMAYDKLLGDHVKVVIFTCSEYEARNYGRFLLGVLTDLWKWFTDEQAFVQDNRTKSGGKTVFLPGFQLRFANKSTVQQDDLLKWTGLKTVVRKWHKKLAKCFIECIQSGEFMHVYNAIIVLKEILPMFPLTATSDHGPALDRVMQEFLEKEERGDLKILGRAYAAGLKKREPSWIVPKAIPSKPNGAVSSPKPSSPATTGGDKVRSNGAVANGMTSSASSTESRRSTALPSGSTPSAPRAQLAHSSNTSQASSDRLTNNGLSSTKLAMESIPRPEVVKRVRPDNKSADPSKAVGEAKAASQRQPDAMEVDTGSSTDKKLPSGPAQPNDTRPSSNPLSSRSDNEPASSPSARKDAPQSRGSSRSQVQGGSVVHSGIGKEPPRSPRSHRPPEDKALRPESQHVMPPPSAPSQTLSAQELRETAKQTIGRRPSPDKGNEKTMPSTSTSRNESGTSSPRPRRRSTSPPTRPGTRNASVESRGSGDRSRSDKGSGDGDRSDDKRSDRENRQDSRDQAIPLGRRDGAPHTRGERGGRDRGSIRDGDRDKERERDGERDRERDRGRDKHGDRERDRDRDRSERDRERDRDRDRDKNEKERERDRDRDRDRHRRDEKDRDRDNRKERDAPSRGSTSISTPTADDRILPTRPDPSRHRNGPNTEDLLGKRRRPSDDEPDRVSKRSSRKDSHRDDRGRRPSDKEAHERTRESDRRRRDREDLDNDRAPFSEKPDDKRVPDGPSSSKVLPLTAPSAPRAMSSSEPSRGKADSNIGRDRDWKSQREQAPHLSQSGAVGSSSADPKQDTSIRSLRSRIGDKETLRPPPQPPSNSYRPDPVHKDDERDGGRKRTMTDREKDAAESTPGPTAEQPPAQPPKRPKINRNRYGETQPHAVAKKLLPIDPQAGDKTRSGRKD